MIGAKVTSKCAFPSVKTRRYHPEGSDAWPCQAHPCPTFGRRTPPKAGARSHLQAMDAAQLHTQPAPLSRHPVSTRLCSGLWIPWPIAKIAPDIGAEHNHGRPRSCRCKPQPMRVTHLAWNLSVPRRPSSSSCHRGTSATGPFPPSCGRPECTCNRQTVEPWSRTIQGARRRTSSGNRSRSGSAAWTLSATRQPPRGTHAVLPVVASVTHPHG